jgi:hypothetical protein
MTPGYDDWHIPDEPDETEPRPPGADPAGGRRKPNGHADPAGEDQPELEPLPHYCGEGYRDAPTRDLLVKRLMGAGELSIVYGQAKVGKSFLVTDLALAVAAAVEKWFGHRIKRQGFVLYCIMEGAGGYPNRLMAWSNHHGRPVPDNFVWVPVRLRFVEDKTVDAAAEDVRRLKALAEQIKAETGLPCVLIVVDTAARAMTGCFVHVTKDAATGNRSWAIQWAKDDGEGQPHGFTLRTVDLGEDEDGDQMRSCTVAPTDTADAGKARRTLRDNEKVAYEALLAAIVDHPDPTPRAHDIPHHAKGVTMKRWREHAVRYLPQDTVKRRNEAFNRAVKTLVADRFVHHVAGFVWTKR